MANRKAVVNNQECVACGCCIKVCPRNAISIPKGIYATINKELCIGCGQCAKECPASVISLEVKNEKEKRMVWLPLDRFPYIFNPGIFQYPICMAWAPLFFYTAFYIGYKRQQGLLQQILRQRAAIFPDRGQIWAFPQKGYSKMDEITLFPKWIFNFLFCNVLQYALEHLAGL